MAICSSFVVRKYREILLLAYMGNWMALLKAQFI